MESSSPSALPPRVPGLTERAGPCPNTPASPGPCLDVCCQPRRAAQTPLRVGPRPHPPLRGPGGPEPPFRCFEAGWTEGDGGASPARTSESRIPEDGVPVVPATASSDSRLFGARERCRCWDCQPADTEQAPGDTQRERVCQRDPCQDLEEELEQPLPLRADSDSQDYGPPAPPYTRLLSHQQGQALDLHPAPPGPFRGPLCIWDPPYGQPHQPHSVCSCQDGRPWMQYPHNWLRSGAEGAGHSSSLGGFSVNAPQFCLPPADCVMQVNEVNWYHPDLGGVEPGERTCSSDSHQKRKTISLPDSCRNIFITYSVDTASTMIPFSEFLTQQGFRPAIDIFDSPIRRMDINQWIGSYLGDPSVLIIIAISSGYKADIERPGMDRHSLHTKYIYSMMQNEFIQQGSLNYRFVPVLFHNAPQSHVPGWLQNTHVYRWPQDKENLLLRLLREERYIAPPVPEELGLSIRPVARSTSSTF